MGAFLRRDFEIARSYRLPFILDVFYGVLQLAVYFFISETFTDFESEDLHGAPSYFGFAAVGVVIALVIEAASDGIASRVREEQLTGSLEALVTQPLSPLQLAIGFTTFSGVFAGARAAIYLAAAAAWMEVDFGEASWLGLIVMLVLTMFSLASLGILAGAVVLVLKRGEVLVGMTLFAMTLVSGSVFPISVLPSWLSVIGSVLPTRFAFDGVRDALFNGSGWESEAIALAVFTAIALPLAIWVFGRALLMAQQAGTLSEY